MKDKWANAGLNGYVLRGILARSYVSRRKSEKRLREFISTNIPAHQVEELTELILSYCGHSTGVCRMEALRRQIP